MKITHKSKELLYLLAEDAENWDGNPLLPELTQEQKGNLLDLIKKGFLEIEHDEFDNVSWVYFTNEGKSFIKENFNIQI